MDYTITVKSYVDYIIAYDSQSCLGMMIPAENYETMILNADQTKTFMIRIPEKTEKLRLELLSYGKVGGRAEYKINDLLSIPINVDTLTAAKNKESDAWTTPIIINTPFQIRDVMIQIPKPVQDLTGLSEWIHPMMIDRKTLKESYKLQASEFAARGIDITGKSWFSQTEIKPQEWGFDEVDEYAKIIDNQMDVRVHCFSLTRICDVDINNS